MSHVGDVLELLFARPDPTVPVHAVVEEHYDADLSEEAKTAYMAELRNDVKGKTSPALKAAMVPAMASAMALAAGVSVSDRIRRRPKPGSRPSGDSRLELWLGPTGRVRMARSYTGPDGPAIVESSMTIDDARAGPGGTAFPQLGDPSGRWPVPGEMDAERHFSHRLLRRAVVGLELADAREGEVAGRPVVVVRGTPRDVDGLWPHGFPIAPDGYTLSFDRQYADLLAFEALAGGTAVASATITAVAYGSPTT